MNSSGRRCQLTDGGAQPMADGSSRALLPADLSLLRIDEDLVIDFSNRPFDPIELGRMLSMLDQLATIA